MISHAIFEGFKNLVRSLSISATAISVIFITLSTVMLVSTATNIFGTAIRQLDNQNAIIAFIKADIKTEDIPAIQKRLEAIPEIKEVKYIDDEAARKELEKNDQNAGSLIQTLRDSNIGLDLAYFNLTPTKSESYSTALEKVRNSDFKDVIDQVRSSQDFANALETFYNWTRWGGLAMVAMFTIISILVLMNILRITIYNHKQEIEIMRLVGATNNYIRGPFIAEGAMYILISSGLALLLFVPALNFALPWIRDWLRITDAAAISSLLFQIYISFAIVIVAATGAGSFTAYYATQKYLDF